MHIFVACSYFAAKLKKSSESRKKLIRKWVQEKRHSSGEKIITYWQIAICDGPVILGFFLVSLCKLVDNCFVEQCSTWSFFLHLWACAKDKKGCPSNISNKEKSNMLKKKRKCCISNYWKTSMSTENYYWNCWKMLKITAEKCWMACLTKNYWNSWKC